MINRLEFSIEIKADKSKIWKALWDDDAYRQWITIFAEGSYMVAENWEVGSKVQFLDPEQNGIFSIIEKHIPNQTIQFKHIGMVAKRIEQPIDEETKKWSGATEIYSLIEGTDHNTLKIEIDIMDEHLDFMSETFPKALERIKNNCE